MRRFSILALLFTGYVAAAKAGLAFATVNPSVTAIWPPTGIAIAAFLLLGRDVWPAIFAAAFVANVTVDGSIAAAIGIAIGNTLEGAVGAHLVTRFANGPRAFDRPADIFRFVACAGLLSPTISATMGATTLSLAGRADWNTYASVWLTWWLGDMAGALLVTPLLVVWTNPSARRWGTDHWLETVMVLISIVLTAAAVFGGFYPPTRNHPIAFFCIPALVWTAFRFGQRETATAVAILSVIAAWGTLRGSGPFSSAPADQQLLLLQAFLGTIAITAMTIAALAAEHHQLLAAEHRARDEAEAANRAKDTFLAMLGHELRNPLAAITTAVHVLERGGSLDAKADRVREVIARQVGQLSRLVDDLLDVTRVTTGKIALHRTRLELREFVERSLETLAAAGRTGQHQVTFDGEQTWIEADTARLEQIITNLVMNAVKYTPAGGSIRVSVSGEREWSVLRVTDAGIGIAPEMLPRIFDLFTQGDPGPGRINEGLGIGLTLVKRLVELHGGVIEGASDGAGRGSRFTVRFPAAARRRRTDRAARKSIRARPRRVLIVEDQSDAREVLSFALQLAGHEVFQASDGPQGIEAAMQHRPDVAVIDIGLPGCDGNEVARQIRQAVDGKPILLIALTGLSHPDDRNRALTSGFNLFLVKPVDPDRLNAFLTGPDSDGQHSFARS